jgi:hypothetical protein
MKKTFQNIWISDGGIMHYFGVKRKGFAVRSFSLLTSETLCSMIEPDGIHVAAAKEKRGIHR